MAIVATLAAGVPARAAWVVDAQGRCVREWAPAAMLRGPTAMLSAPTAPFREAAGVFTDMSPGPGIWGPPLAGLSFMGGLIDTVVWLGTGIADTVTGGYFAIAPTEATALGVAPMRPAFVRPAPAKPQDRCGRPRAS